MTTNASLRSLLLAGLATLCALAAILPTSARATCPGDGEMPTEETIDGERAVRADLGGGRIITGTAHQRVLHFTFDDGPSRRHTPEVLDTLDRAGWHATFFVVARRLEHSRDREIVREVARRGHTIGLHSYAHDDLTEESVAALGEELTRSEELFTSVLGARPWLFRPPYGHHDDGVDETLASRGYTEVLWNVHGSDVTARTADEVVESFRSQLDAMREGRAGGVVLLHDTHAWTAEALPRIVTEIHDRNCEALADGEDLWDVAPDLSPWMQARDGAAATRSAARMDVDDAVWAARQETLREATAPTCA